MSEPRKLDKPMSDDTRIALLEQSIGHINETLIRIDKRLDNIENEMKQGFKEINNRLWSNFLWLIGSMAGLLALVAHALHWI